VKKPKPRHRERRPASRADPTAARSSSEMTPRRGGRESVAPLPDQLNIRLKEGGGPPLTGLQKGKEGR